MARLSLSLPAASALIAMAACNAPAPTPPATPTPPVAAPTPTKPFMFVINGLSYDVDRVDLTTGKVAKSVLKIGKIPNQLVAVGTTGYAVNYGDNNIFKLDLAAPAKVSEITFPPNTGPQTIAPFGSGKAVVAADDGKAAILVDLGTGATEGTVALGAKVGLGGIAVAQNKAYVPVYQQDTSTWAFTYGAVKVVDLTSKSVQKTIDLPNDANPYSASVDPDGKVQVGTTNGVVTIDPATDTAVRTIDVGGEVKGIVYASAEKAYGLAGEKGSWAYDGLVVFNPKTGTVTRNVANRIKTGGSLGNLKLRGTTAYLPDFNKDRVTVVDLTAEATSSVYTLGDVPDPAKPKYGPQDLVIVDIEQ